MKKYKDTINESLGTDVIDKSINSLQKAFGSKGVLVKKVSGELGSGYTKDFKKLEDLMFEVEDLWQDIYKDMQQM